MKGGAVRMHMVVFAIVSIGIMITGIIVFVPHSFLSRSFEDVPSGERVRRISGVLLIIVSLVFGVIALSESSLAGRTLTDLQYRLNVDPSLDISGILQVTAVKKDEIGVEIVVETSERMNSEVQMRTKSSIEDILFTENSYMTISSKYYEGRAFDTQLSFRCDGRVYSNYILDVLQYLEEEEAKEKALQEEE